MVMKPFIKDTFSGVKKDHCVSCGASLEDNNYDRNGNYCDHCCSEAVLFKNEHSSIRKVLEDLRIK